MGNVDIEPIRTIWIDMRIEGTPLTTHTGEGYKLAETWFQQHVTSKVQEKYNMVFFVFSKEERKLWNLSPQWAGLYYVDRDSTYECYVIVEENDDNEFKRIMIHEALHGAVRMAGVLDELNKLYYIPYKIEKTGKVIDNIVHHFDYVVHDVSKLAPLISFKRWSLMSQVIPLLEKLITKLISMKQTPKEIPVPEVPPTPQVETKPSRLVDLAKAIEVFEDYVRPVLVFL